MPRPRRDQPIELQQILDRLGVTPEQLLHHHNAMSDRLTSSPERLGANILRPDRLASSPQRLGAKIRGALDSVVGGLKWRINPDRLMSNLSQELEPRGVGFCYMLNRAGKPPLHHRGGEARVTVPAITWLNTAAVPGLAWDIDVPTNLASVSKLITGIATVMLCKENGVDLGSPVADHLPVHWQPHWGNLTISFRDLLRHESGLGWIEKDSGPGDYFTARKNMELGSSGTGAGKFDYKNLNFIILRATFPIVAKLVPRDLPLAGGQDSFWDYVSMSFYRDYCNRRIFAAANVGPFDFKAPAEVTRAYGTPPLPPGAEAGDVTSDAGSSGWYLTLEELMKVAAEFRRGRSMMTPKQAERLLEDLYGVNEIYNTKAGAVYAKRGEYKAGSNTLETGIFFLPNNLELGVFINSSPASGGSYNNAIGGRIAASVEPF